jgi:hypothetical protein
MKQNIKYINFLKNKIKKITAVSPIGWAMIMYVEIFKTDVIVLAMR